MARASSRTSAARDTVHREVDPGDAVPTWRRIFPAVVWLAGVSFAVGAVGAETQPTGDRGCIVEGGAEGCTPGRALRSVTGIAMSPDGRNIYAAASTSRAVAALVRRRRDGTLRQLDGTAGCVSEPAIDGCAAGRNLDVARAAAVSPDGRNVYVVTQGGIAAFARDPGTGALRQLDGEDGCVREDGALGCARARAVSDGRMLAITPDGRTLYAVGADSAVAAFRRDRASGALSQLPGPSGCVKQAGFEPEGCAEGRGLTKSRAVLVHGRSVYVASEGEALTSQAAAVAVFRRERASGELRQMPAERGCLNADGAEGCMPVRGLIGPHDVVVGRGGRSLYVIGSSSPADGGLAVLTRLPPGRLHQLPGPAGCFTHDGSDGCARARGLAGAHTLTLAARDRHAFVASENDGGSLAVLVPRGSNGALRQPSDAAGCLNADGSEGCAVARALRGAHQTVLAPDGRYLYAAVVLGNGVVVLRVR
jgi:DNA-binding beta-propeller fold protein YncE